MAAEPVFEPSASTRRVREQIDHPVIDSDGHLLEYLPAVREILRDLAGGDAVAAFEAILDAQQNSKHMTPEERRNFGLFRLTWWGFPAENTLDRATAMLPQLQYERLPELGIDYAVVYPTFGLTAQMVEQDELRLALVRSFNRYYAESYEGLGDRLCPVALIPMHTPDEAIEELDYVVGTLGMKAALFAGFVYRQIGGEDAPRSARWVDTFTWESPHDYDPVWARCVELGVNPTFHSSAMGWHRGSSQTNYVFNHIGNFAVAGETTCRSLFMDGVPMRHPSLQFAFLEGGVGWGCNLYSDVLGHYEKRSGEAVRIYDPNLLDRAQLRGLFDRYANKRDREQGSELEESLYFLADPNEDPNVLDEFERSGVAGPDDIRRIFTEQFHFGCEADDPMNALAFDTRVNPKQARLSAIFGSDVGHWDVPDCREVLGEAYELVDKELLDADEFRAFVYDNPKRLWTNNRPDFFAGTAIEGSN